MMPMERQKRHIVSSIRHDEQVGHCAHCGPDTPLYYWEKEKRWFCATPRREAAKRQRAARVADGRGRPSREEQHTLTDIDMERGTATCAQCGPRADLRWHGERVRCATPAREAEARRELKRHPHLALRGETCERCGFVPAHPCQLDVHHRDHDNGNNDPANLETVCANCHRLIHSATRRRWTDRKWPSDT